MPRTGGVAVAGDGDGVCVVEEPVEAGRGQQRIAEEVRPLVQGSIAGDDE